MAKHQHVLTLCYSASESSLSTIRTPSNSPFQTPLLCQSCCHTLWRLPQAQPCLPLNPVARAGTIGSHPRRIGTRELEETSQGQAEHVNLHRLLPQGSEGSVNEGFRKQMSFSKCSFVRSPEISSAALRALVRKIEARSGDTLTVPIHCLYLLCVYTFVYHTYESSCVYMQGYVYIYTYV